MRVFYIFVRRLQASLGKDFGLKVCVVESSAFVHYANRGNRGAILFTRTVVLGQKSFWNFMSPIETLAYVLTSLVVYAPLWLCCG
jgi:hypothetical protein